MSMGSQTGCAYPEAGADVTVAGTFETYEEDGTLYARIVDSSLVVG